MGEGDFWKHQNKYRAGQNPCPDTYSWVSSAVRDKKREGKSVTIYGCGVFGSLFKIPGEFSKTLGCIVALAKDMSFKCISKKAD